MPSTRISNLFTTKQFNLLKWGAGRLASFPPARHLAPSLIPATVSLRPTVTIFHFLSHFVTIPSDSPLSYLHLPPPLRTSPLTSIYSPPPYELSFSVSCTSITPGYSMTDRSRTLFILHYLPSSSRSLYIPVDSVQ